ncbi:MAG: choice-of-anchor D domain-containing protein [Deltaproteobacteria bacterium]|nr:choice-of-anchor D domain-containing protein [Deltaproteobacteria bacterium]
MRRPLLLLLGALPLLHACPETEIVALDPAFSIGWPLDSGWIPGDLEQSVLAFGEVTTGQVSTIPITMTNPGDASLRFCEVGLAAVTFDDAGQVTNEIRIEADPEIALFPPMGETLAAGSGFQLSLRYIPLLEDELAGGLHFVVKHALNWDCDTNAGTGLYVPIAGGATGEPVPDIYSKPAQVDFGTTFIESSAAPQTVLVGNGGPGLLEVGQATLADGTHFGLDAAELSGSSFTLGDWAFITVFFNPQAAGSHSTDIVIPSNDPDEPELRIPVQGTADPTPIDDPPGDDDDSSPPPPSGGIPIAVCGSTIFANPLEVVTLSSVSFHTGGFGPTLSLQYSWTLAPPAGSITTLSNANTANASTSPYVDVVGSYIGTLTVTDAAGLTDSCTQTIEVLPPENFRVELFWDAEDDFDLHLLEANDGAGNQGTPNTGSDCYFGNCTSLGLDWGVPGDIYDNPYLDLDDISGFGPENINITDPALAPYDGWYQVMVHDYTGSTDDNYGTTNGTLSIYLNQVLAQTYGFSMSGDGDQYYVAKIHWPTGQVTPCNGLSGCP